MSIFCKQYFQMTPHSITIYQDLTKKGVVMIVKDLQPLSIVEGEDFREFTEALNPQYKMPCRTTMHKYLMLMYDE